MAARTSAAMAAPERAFVITRLLDAPRDLVFEAWTRPEHMVRWWGPRDFTVPACEVDFRPGGAFRVCIRSPDGSDYWIRGVYCRIVAPEHLDFTCEADDAKGNLFAAEFITVTLAEYGSKTKLTLHIRIEWPADAPAMLGRMEASWNQSLDRLAAHASHTRGAGK